MSRISLTVDLQLHFDRHLLVWYNRPRFLRPKRGGSWSGANANLFAVGKCVAPLCLPASCEYGKGQDLRQRQGV